MRPAIAVKNKTRCFCLFGNAYSKIHGQKTRVCKLLYFVILPAIDVFIFSRVYYFVHRIACAFGLLCFTGLCCLLVKLSLTILYKLYYHLSGSTVYIREILSATRAAGARGHRLRRRRFKSSKSTISVANKDV